VTRSLGGHGPAALELDVSSECLRVEKRFLKTGKKWWGFSHLGIRLGDAKTCVPTLDEHCFRKPLVAVSLSTVSIMLFCFCTSMPSGGKGRDRFSHEQTALRVAIDKAW
jgi:hypothetical protein